MQENQNARDIISLSHRIDALEKSNRRLWENQDDLKLIAHQTVSKLNQFKYILIGGLGTLVAQSFGIFEAIKLMIKL